MKATLEIRPPEAAEAPRIVELIRAGFAPELVDLFIYGCHGAVRYVAAQIGAASRGGDTQYLVALDGVRILGCIELRVLPERLFLNYIAVAPEARGHGIGSRLLHAGLARTAGPSQKIIALDVLEDNRTARTWYERLGFVEEGMTEWWTLDLRGVAAKPGLLGGLPQADVCHAVFGFSRFTLLTSAGSHDVGRLGERWFRVVGAAALTDEALAPSLSSLDRSRNLLALVPRGAMTSNGRAMATLATSTRRLSAEIEPLRACFEAMFERGAHA